MMTPEEEEKFLASLPEDICHNCAPARKNEGETLQSLTQLERTEKKQLFVGHCPNCDVPEYEAQTSLF